MYRNQFLNLIVFILASSGFGASAEDSLLKPYEIYAVDTYASSVAIGDIDSDGLNDVVLSSIKYGRSSPNDNSIHLFHQDETRSLAYGGAIHVDGAEGSYHPNSVKISDLNNDGLHDIAAATQDGVGVFIQNRFNTLNGMLYYPSNHTSFANSYRIGTGDFNKDGLNDLVSINFGLQSYDVDIYFQNINESFDQPEVHPVVHRGFDDLAVGDITGDGVDDIVVMSGNGIRGGGLGVLVAMPDNGFSEPEYYDIDPSVISEGVAIGDLNGDGLNDVVVSKHDNRSPHLLVLYQDSDGVLEPPTRLDTHNSPGPIEIGDMNADGRDDIIVLHDGYGKLGVFLQQDGGSMAPEILFPIPYNYSSSSHSLSLGDIDNNGMPDITIAAGKSGLIVLRNNLSYPEADIAVEVTQSNAKLAFHKENNYFVRVSNGGPGDAFDIVLTITVPKDVTLASASHDCIITDVVITCRLDDLWSGRTDNFQLSLVPNYRQTLDVSFSVNSSVYDPDETNNSVSLTANVLGQNHHALEIINSNNGGR